MAPKKPRKTQKGRGKPPVDLRDLTQGKDSMNIVVGYNIDGETEDSSETKVTKKTVRKKGSKTQSGDETDDSSETKVTKKTVRKRGSKTQSGDETEDNDVRSSKGEERVTPKRSTREKKPVDHYSPDTIVSPDKKGTNTRYVLIMQLH